MRRGLPGSKLSQLKQLIKEMSLGKGPNGRVMLPKQGSMNKTNKQRERQEREARKKKSKEQDPVPTHG